MEDFWCKKIDDGFETKAELGTKVEAVDQKPQEGHNHRQRPTQGYRVIRYDIISFCLF